MRRAKVQPQSATWRLWFVLIAILCLFVVGLWKVWDLQVLDNEYLQHQGDARTVRNEVITAHRGNILDRNGQPLAISTPVQSLWLNPREILQYPQQWQSLANALEAVGVDAGRLRERINGNAQREFLYIRRRMSPAQAESVLKHNFAGVYAQEEYKRYYPLGEVASHLVGLTNTDDVGQEGIELAYEEWLHGVPGSRQVLKDRLGRIIREIKVNHVAEPGQDLYLSIDSRIQHLAYRELKEAVAHHRAVAGTATVLDVASGEVLAVVNQPSYNPNNRSSMTGVNMRNRALVDLLEPGSTVKPFTVIAALESGEFTLDSIVDTNPGSIRVDRTTIRDPINYKEMSLERIITKSSQVGAIKLGLAMGHEPMTAVLSRFGFGQIMGTGFPGEAFGLLPGRPRWSKADVATMAYGYGFQASPMQLAQAYLIFANEGRRKPISLIAGEGSKKPSEQVISKSLNQAIVSMMETVVSEEEGGTGVRAALDSYRVAGKTGTAWRYDVKGGGYDRDSYISLFAGLVPATDPEVVIVVTIHQPQGEEYGGGQVAAPVFAEIARGALRILNIPPDAMQGAWQEISQRNGVGQEGIPL